MSEQENNGTEEQVIPTEHEQLDAAERGDLGNEGTETEAIEVTLLGKIINKTSEELVVTDAIASEGAEWIKKPGNIPADGETEFDIQMVITEGHELTGTIHLEPGIDLYFDVNGEDNHASSSQRVLGPIVVAEISRGPHAMVQYTISAGPAEG